MIPSAAGADCLFYIIIVKPVTLIQSCVVQLVRRLIFCQKVRGSNPALTTFFRVFESFQGFLPFVVLESVIVYLNPQQLFSVQKTHFFVIILTESAFKS